MFPALAVLCLLTLLLARPVRVGTEPKALPRSTPEQQGVSSSALLAFVDAVDAEVRDMNSFMLLRHGHVVAEGWWAPYDAGSRHLLFSLTKSFTSTAVGLAIAEGRLALTDPVLPFFPDEAPADPGPTLKAMRIRDLLTMSTGQHVEVPLGSRRDWTRAFLAHPVDHKPGTFFLYNTPASYMLSAIVQKATGAPLAEYLRPRLFDAIGIDEPEWETSPEGISIGGYGMKIRTEDIARFGQLYLQKGEWQGRRVVPAEWIAAATSRQMSNGSNPDSDWEQGYGFQFWRCRHGAYRADGAHGQFCIVLPEQDAVVVITSGVKDMQSVLNKVWDRLLPALGAAPLPADTGNQQKLAARLAALALPPQAGAPTAAMASRIAGRRFAFPANDQQLEWVTLEPGEGGTGATLVARIQGVERRLASGIGRWEKGRLAYGPLPEQPVAVSGAWTAADTYTALVRFYETPFALTLRLQFTASQVRYDAEFNVGRAPTKQPTLTGVSS